MSLDRCDASCRELGAVAHILRHHPEAGLSACPFCETPDTRNGPFATSFCVTLWDSTDPRGVWESVWCRTCGGTLYDGRMRP